MSYHPNNIPPSYVQSLLSYSDFSNHNDCEIYKTEFYVLIQQENDKSIRHIGERHENSISVRHATVEEAIAMVDGLTAKKLKSSLPSYKDLKNN